LIHFCYSWASLIARQVQQPFNQTLQPQLAAIVVECDYLTVYGLPRNQKTHSNLEKHSSSDLSGPFESDLNSFVVPPKKKKNYMCVQLERALHLASLLAYF